MNNDLPPPYASSYNIEPNLPNYSSSEQLPAAGHQPSESFITLTIPDTLDRSNSGIRIGTVKAHKSLSFLAGASYVFDLRKPDWYVSLDTWEQGIIECNQTLHILYVRHLRIGLLCLFAAIMSMVALFLGISETIPLIAMSALQLVCALIILGSIFSKRYICKDPVAKLQSKVSGMGWTLEGFERLFQRNDTIPSIIVTR